MNDLFFPPGDPLFQFKLGQDPVIFSVKVFGGLIDIGAYGDDGGAVLDLRNPFIGLYPGYKIPDITGGLRMVASV